MDIEHVWAAFAGKKDCWTEDSATFTCDDLHKRIENIIVHSNDVVL